jgi:hypothetical protein
MVLIDIINNIIIKPKISVNFKFKVIDTDNYQKSFLDDIKINDIIDKNIEIDEFLGEGSYGKVYKIKIDNNFYALKLNNNEIPEKLNERYLSLCKPEKLSSHIIKIYMCGNIYNYHNNEFKYYCIMEFGGNTLKNLLNNINDKIICSILKQLYNIVIQAVKYKLLITDLKLGNLTLNDKNKIKLIDIYMYCGDYSNCNQCKIVKTYSAIEFEKEKRIYEKNDYNMSGLFIPLAICIIDLLCKNKSSYYFDKLSKKYNLNMNIKELLPLIQIACFNYNNDSNISIKEYNNLYKFKKDIESKFNFLSNKKFFVDFLNLLEIKDIFKYKISKRRLAIILNNMFSLDPKQRSLDIFKSKLINW